MSITSLFHSSYWFAVPPSISDTALIILLVVFGVMLVVGVTLKSVATKEKVEHFTGKILARWGSWSIVMGLLGFLYTFLRYERTLVFSLRMWLGVWFLVAFSWVYRLYVYQTKKIPELRARHRESAQKYAYLLKRNSR